MSSKFHPDIYFFLLQNKHMLIWESENQGTCPQRLVNHDQLCFHLLRWWSKRWNAFKCKGTTPNSYRKIKTFPPSCPTVAPFETTSRIKLSFLLSISNCRPLVSLFIFSCRGWYLGRLNAGDPSGLTSASLYDCVTAATASVRVEKKHLWVTVAEFSCWCLWCCCFFVKPASPWSRWGTCVQNAQELKWNISLSTLAADDLVWFQ